MAASQALLESASVSTRRPVVPRGVGHGVGVPRHRHAGRRRITRHWWFWASASLVLVVTLAVAWVAVRALQAKDHLDAAIPLATEMKGQVLAQDFEAIPTTYEKAAAHISEAAGLANDPIWRVAEFVPALGVNLSAVRELTSLTDDMMSSVVGPLIDTLTVFDPASLKLVDGALDLEPIKAAATNVVESNLEMRAVLRAVDAVNVDGAIGQVAAAKEQLSGMLGELAPQLETAASAVSVLPGMLGADGPRTYVLMFMNSAEVRSLGGTALSFSPITTDEGRIEIGEAVPAGFQNFPEYFPGQVVPIPDGAAELYQHGTYATFIANATMRPDFATAGQITSRMWSDNIGGAVDGVIAVDPTALGYAMAGIEPVQLSTGDLVTSETLVPLLLNEVYQRYWSRDIVRDNVMQDLVYAETVGAISDRITSGQFEPGPLFGGVAQAISERRMLFWSAHESEQAVFTTLGLAGTMPHSDAATDRVGIYFQDDVGSKMSFYLHSAVSLNQAICRDDGRQQYRVSVTLTNAIPANPRRTISPSILGTFERSNLDPGVQRTMVFVLAPPGAEIVTAAVDGKAVELKDWHDEQYPAARFVVTTDPQASSEIVLDVVASASGEKQLEAQVTPMINRTVVTTGSLDCSTPLAGLSESAG